MEIARIIQDEMLVIDFYEWDICSEISSINDDFDKGNIDEDDLEDCVVDALTEAFGKTFAGCLKEAIVNAVLCQD